MAKAVLTDQERWQTEMERQAVADLLALKNDVWREEDEALVDAAQFVARMVPEALSTYPEGDFDFTFQDGDLFWGHVILVGGTLAEGVTEAQIAG